MFGTGCQWVNLPLLYHLNIVLPFVIKEQFFQPMDKAAQTYDY